MFATFLQNQCVPPVKINAAFVQNQWLTVNPLPLSQKCIVLDIVLLAVIKTQPTITTY